ncbi:hypothetical protein [Streptomyces flavofungini]|uniref:Uncharacterized protein n=1 Tax=Streptomyces flavofungini TaxID=68200 RepID=A0ABS0X6I7_9ACTN|nr:hypothetical protein [Streptomyces flavofungini]MBJ3808822.1 hypothetical protein [Streptomyces flavofungini]GHC49049.1 hypothetical protein GCM10010349_13120 [Streptomyces flavofungini]
MPTAIAVTSPELVLPSPDRHTPTAAVLQGVAQSPKTSAARTASSLDDALTEMHTLIEHHGHVIVLCPASAPPAVPHRLHAIRSVLESDRIAIVRSDLPPLGLSVLALQLRQLSICDFSPGVLACAARLLSHYIYAGALLGSVAKLDRVPVSLRSHTKSWVPGAQFAVLAAPRPELVKLGGEALPAGPGFSTKLLYAAGQLAPDWVVDTLAPAWNAQGCADVELPADSPRWWATGKVVEFAAAIPDISVLYQLVSSVRREDCHWCGLELIGDRCAFCAAPMPPAAPEPAVHALPRGGT